MSGIAFFILPSPKTDLREGNKRERRKMKRRKEKNGREERW
jgi:hypothetical protein